MSGVDRNGRRLLSGQPYIVFPPGSEGFAPFAVASFCSCSSNGDARVSGIYNEEKIEASVDPRMLEHLTDYLAKLAPVFQAECESERPNLKLVQHHIAMVCRIGIGLIKLYGFVDAGVGELPH